jgi:hypothetical protein
MSSPRRLAQIRVLRESAISPGERVVQLASRSAGLRLFESLGRGSSRMTGVGQHLQEPQVQEALRQAQGGERSRTAGPALLPFSLDGSFF